MLGFHTISACKPQSSWNPPRRTVRQRALTTSGRPYLAIHRRHRRWLRVAARRQDGWRWVSQWSIEQRVLAGFGLVFLGILVISVMSYRNTAVVVKNSRLDTASHELIQLLGSIEEALIAAESGHRRYLVTGDESYLKAYRGIVEQMPGIFAVSPGRWPDLPDNRSASLSWNSSSSSNWTLRPNAIRERDTRGAEAVRHLALPGVAKRELDDIHRLIADFETTEQQATGARVLQSAGTTRSTIALLALGGVLQLVLLGSVYYLIHHDITNRRRVAAELRRQGELLQAANKELEAFSYSVSHDLRAPLRHIDGYAALLSKAAGEALDEKAQRYLQTISDSAKQMGQLIDDLLVFSRMGRQEMLRTTVNLNQLIKAVIQDLRLDLQGRTISWKLARCRTCRVTRPCCDRCL